MTAKEILKIIQVVVEYGWGWQLNDDFSGDGWISMPNASLQEMFRYLYKGYDIRLDPIHVWDWPVECREGMPCWAREDFRITIGPESSTGPWFQGVIHRGILLGTDGNELIHQQRANDLGRFWGMQIVTPHPLNPTMEPPSGWSPENKRILK